MEYPTNIRIVKKKGEDYLRLSYNSGNVRITTQGFKTNNQLAKIIRNDEFFKIKLTELKED